MTSALVGDGLPPVVELRRYTLRPGRREELVDLFERELLGPQEEAGMRVLGQFRDLDRPDRFVWLRGFPGMAARAGALSAFYGGPVWARHRDAANATMLDSDDVLLLRPVGPAGTPPAGGAGGGGGSVVAATVLLLREPADDELLGRWSAEVEPALERAGGRRLALLVTEPAANTFPRLPVREGEHALVHLATHRSAARAAAAREVLSDPVWALLLPWLAAAPQTLRLLPTARSWLR